MRSRLISLLVRLLPLLLAVPFFWRLDAEEFHGDESHWITSGQQAWHLVTSGQLSHPQWREEFYFYSQPQVGKLLIGGALAAAGFTGPAWIVEYDWQLPPAENRAIGRVPPEAAILAGRIPSALAGWLTCLLLWHIAAFLGARAAGPLAAVLLASHPLWLANARRAGLDSTALCLGLAAALAAISALRSDATPDEPAAPKRTLARWLVAGLLLGLAVSTKYVALLAAPLAGAAALPLVVRRAWRRPLIGAAIALPVAVLVFLAADPALYPDPLGGLGLSLGFLAEQAEGMRYTMPGFRSPLWVAAEIVDRVGWPLGFPHVVDASMPEPLVPGTYGTPIVALGAGIALAFMARRRSLPASNVLPLAITGAWCIAVYGLLVLSVPTWWERWHLPLVLPLCLLAALGLAALPRTVAWALAGAQAVAALAMLPSYLGRGWGALVLHPAGAAAHLAALAFALVTLVSLSLRVRGGPAE